MINLYLKMKKQAVNVSDKMLNIRQAVEKLFRCQGFDVVETED